MIPGFSCHGHGEISAGRRAREEVLDNNCRPSFRFFSLSAPLLCCYSPRFLRSVSLFAKRSRQWATGGGWGEGHRNFTRETALGTVTATYPESSLFNVFIFKSDKMVDFLHLFCQVKTLSPLRLWPLFHSGFIIKQSFFPPLFQWR